MGACRYLRAGTLLDGTGGPPVPSGVIAIEDGTIVEVGNADSIAVPEMAEVIDATRYVVIPGLVDAHVHIHAPGGPTDEGARLQLVDAQGTLSLKAYAHAMEALAVGFTTLRSLGSPAYVDVAVRNAVETGLLAGPRLLVSGQGLSITGGHMDKAMWSPELYIPGRTGVCDSPREFRRSARTQLKWGADVVKINVCVGDYESEDRPWRVEMSYEEISVVCEEAHRLGKRVAAHTAGGSGITDAILAGVDTIEHAHWLTDEQIDLMAEHGTYYVPTLFVNTRSLQYGPTQRGMTACAWRWLNKVYTSKWKTLERAKRAGVRIAAGSDAGFAVRHGENAGELCELVRGGFSPLEALEAATRVGAECLGIDEFVGTIEPGKRADMVVLTEDPSEDIRVLERGQAVTAVYRGGCCMWEKGSACMGGVSRVQEDRHAL